MSEIEERVTMVHAKLERGLSPEEALADEHQFLDMATKVALAEAHEYAASKGLRVDERDIRGEILSDTDPDGKPLPVYEDGDSITVLIYINVEDPRADQ